MATTQSEKSSGITKSGRASARPDDAVSDLIGDLERAEAWFDRRANAAGSAPA